MLLVAAESFEKLRIWQKAHELALRIYHITVTWPNAEKFGLISQIRRAAVSVTLNIAEGHSRYHYKETIQFCYQARASADEVRSCLMLARDLSEIVLDQNLFNELNNEYIDLKKGINSFIKAIQSKRSNQLIN